MTFAEWLVQRRACDGGRGGCAMTTAPRLVGRWDGGVLDAFCMSCVHEDFAECKCPSPMRADTPDHWWYIGPDGPQCSRYERREVRDDNR
jgi:hypothetical protein